jgi:hypothetical protein
MYRTTPSLVSAEICEIAFRANLLEDFICSSGGQRLPGAKYPDAVFLEEGPASADGAEGDLFAGSLDFQSITCFQAQLLAQALWNDDTACLVDRKARSHFAIVPWFNPCVNAISAVALARGGAEAALRTRSGKP